MVDAALFKEWSEILTALNETAEEPMLEEEIREQAAWYAREGITFARLHVEVLGEVWREERERPTARRPHEEP